MFMKNLKFLQILILLVSLSSCNSCEEEEWTTLPPETQTGANTFGCYVNGEPFVKDGRLSPGQTKPYAAEYIRQQNLLIVYSTSKLGLIYISVNNPQERVASTISSASFLSNTKLTKCTTYYGENIGKITITKFDTINNIASGNFALTLNCELYHNPGTPDSILSVTDGRFDIKLDIYNNY
jgi:hypothetical protein